jgi:methionine sulfoxide reductase heme-binding subunit
MLKRFSPYLIWAVLALPALSIVTSMFGTDTRALHHAVGASGEWAARMLILALSVTPITMLFKGWEFTRILRKSRRYLGVAAFAYGALHVVAYVMGEASLAKILADVTKPEYLFGWAAFALFLPLAATSTDWAMRMMGPAWKTLQRWTYVAAAGVLLHWSLLHGGHGIGAALVNFSPWFALTAYRLWYWYLRPRPALAA